MLFFLFKKNIAIFAFNFTCKNKCYLNDKFLQRASIYMCWGYTYVIMTLDMFM